MIEALGQADLFDWAGRFALVFGRVFGIMYFLPIFGSQVIPMRLRVFLSLAMTLVLLPIVGHQVGVPHDVAGWVVTGSRELLIGLGFGIAAKAVFAGIEAAASLVAGQSGFTLANMVDPLSGDQALAPALFQNMIVFAMFLAADLHHLIVQAMVESYEVAPPVARLAGMGTLGHFADVSGTRLFTLAALLAGPALVVTFSIDLLLALVGRAMTQVPILLVGYPVKLAAGLLALILLTTTTSAMLGGIGRTIAADGMTVMRALAGG